MSPQTRALIINGPSHVRAVHAAVEVLVEAARRSGQDRRDDVAAAIALLCPDEERGAA